MPVLKEKPREEVQFEQNLELLKGRVATASIKPILREEKEAAKEYERFRPVIEKLVKIGEAARKLDQQSQTMARAIAPNEKEFREHGMKQAFVGAATSFVAVAGTVIGAPLVNAYSLVKEGKTSVTANDIKEMFGAAGKYINADQSRAYLDFFKAAGEFENATQSFYKAFNSSVMEFGERGQISEKTVRELSSALYEVATAHAKLKMNFQKHGANLDELSGFYTVSSEFAKEAAVTAATSFAAGYAIGKGAHLLLHATKEGMHVAKGTAVAATAAARIERAAVAAGQAGEKIIRAERLVVAGERVAEAGHKIHEVQHAGHLMEEHIEGREKQRMGNAALAE